MKSGSLSKISGMLIGGAVGDALGAPVEFMSTSEIFSRFGPNGILKYYPAYGRIGAVTDDTQMSLFTAEGLILSKVRAENPKKILMQDVVIFGYHACLRWLATQEKSQTDLVRQHGSCAIIDGILSSRPEMYARRAPGNSCLSALKSGKMGTIKEMINNSKGCGGVMRIAPVGVFMPPDSAFETGCRLASLTHGHPTGYLAAGCLSQIICEILHGADILKAVETTIKILKAWPNHEETLNSLKTALNFWQQKPVCFETVEQLGQGWTAEEALAIGVYCALASGGDFAKGICLAVNHSGDSDSTGAIAGNILGAALGVYAIPQKYTKNLELIDIIEEIANDLFEHSPD